MAQEIPSLAFPNDTSVVSVKGGFGVALLTIVAFTILNFIVSVLGVPTIVLKYATKKDDESWKWKNLALSWIHASIIGVWDLSCFYFYPELWQDLINHITPYTYYMVAVSAGYFIYDFGDLLIHKKAFKMWELSAHHVAVISIFVYNLYNRTCIGYNVVALLTEVNSIFLHLRKLMQMLRVPFASVAYRVNAAVNLASFLVFRGFCLARITYGMVAEWRRLEPGYLCLLGGAMFVMNMINPALFLILVKNDVLKKHAARAKPDAVARGGSDKAAERNGKID